MMCSKKETQEEMEKEEMVARLIQRNLKLGTGEVSGRRRRGGGGGGDIWIDR